MDECRATLDVLRSVMDATMPPRNACGSTSMKYHDISTNISTNIKQTDH